MSIQLFLTLFIILSAISALFTQTLKEMCKDDIVKPSTNLFAIINAAVVGGGGLAAAYVWLEIPFTFPNILSIVAMIFAVWIGSMVGYDKVTQLITQIKGEFK